MDTLSSGYSFYHKNPIVNYKIHNVSYTIHLLLILRTNVLKCQNSNNGLTSSVCVFCVYTPYELVYSKKSNIPQNLLNGIVDPIYNIERFANEAKFRLQNAHIDAQRCLEAMKINNKNIYDTKLNPLNIQINDCVILEKGAKHKFDSIYDGPYVVKSINAPNVDIMHHTTKKKQTVHMNRLKKYQHNQVTV